MKALLINGPPRSGKDTLGRILSLALPNYRTKFALPITLFMRDAYGINMKSVDKDAPHDLLHGRTPREVAIRYSEGFCKPLYGNDYFGRCAVDRLKGLALDYPLMIFTDSGFAQEADSVVKHLGKPNVMRLHLTRPGCTFQGDSRGLSLIHI